MQGRSSTTPFPVHLLALAVAVALPILMTIWLLQPLQPLPLRRAMAVDGDGLSLNWVPAVRLPTPILRPPSRSIASDVVSPMSGSASVRVAPTAQEHTPAAGSEASGGLETGIGLPADPGGAVYDPSTAQATAVHASAFLRAATPPVENAPARVSPISLAEHSPIPPASHGMTRSVAGLEFILDRVGLVTEISLIQGSGDGNLDAAILDAARSWTFEPARVDGETAASRFRLEVILERDADSSGSR